MKMQNENKEGQFVSFLIVMVIFLVLIFFGVGIYWIRTNEQDMLLTDAATVQETIKHKTLFIQCNNSTNNIKSRLNLRSFLASLQKFPNIESSVIEGVGDDVSLLRSLIEQEVVQNNVKFIFLVGFTYSIELTNIFRSFPNVTFFLYDGESREGNVINYIPRTYNMKYLLGILAGGVTKTDKIAYVADVKNASNMRALNAFAIGVAKVNPKAKIIVTWTHDTKDLGAASFLIEKMFEQTKVDLITGSLEVCVWCELAKEQKDMLYIGQFYNSTHYDKRYISSFTYNMEPCYDYLLRAITNGMTNIKSTVWFGTMQGVVDIDRISPYVNDKQRKYFDYEFDKMRKYVNFVFKGPIFSNDHRRIVLDDAIIPDHELGRLFNWYNYNIREFALDGNYYREHVKNTQNDNNVSVEIMSVEKAKNVANIPIY